ncbi:MAG: AAA family ATPase, partial [bacterium]
ALSMLRTFFEAEIGPDGERADNSRYFEGMKIMGCGEEMLSKMGKFPVIKLSLKSAKQPDFRTAVLRLRDQIVSEFLRHEYLCGSKRLSATEIQTLKDLMLPEREIKIRSEEDLLREMGRYATSLQFLSSALAKHHGQNVIVLLDEYDVPLENAWFAGFYERMVDFIRSLFESVLKTNDALEFAVVTGCLRISRESIFTGLNHLKINSIREDSFAEGFGFTEEETENMLLAYGLADRIPEAKEWYNGYLFGEKKIYNPWSIINYVDGVVNGGKQFPEPYWSNTSSNAIVKDLIWHADEERKKELELLVEGGIIEKKIHEDITYGDIYENEDNLWNFLFFTGYLKKVSERAVGEDIYVTMTIPNLEIRSIYRNHIRGWFENAVKKSDKTIFYKAVLDGDTEGMENFLTDLLDKCISTFDSSESFYHGVFLSLLYGVPGYEPRSNREEGNGRPDIVLEPRRPRNPAIIFELKTRKKFTEMQGGLREAFGQIRDQRYEEGVLNDGFFSVISYGVCFCKKTCIIERYPG